MSACLICILSTRTFSYTLAEARGTLTKSGDPQAVQLVEVCDALRGPERSVACAIPCFCRDLVSVLRDRKVSSLSQAYRAVLSVAVLDPIGKHFTLLAGAANTHTVRIKYLRDQYSKQLSDAVRSDMSQEYVPLCMTCDGQSVHSLLINHVRSVTEGAYASYTLFSPETQLVTLRIDRAYPGLRLKLGRSVRFAPCVLRESLDNVHNVYGKSEDARFRIALAGFVFVMDGAVGCVRRIASDNGCAEYCTQDEDKVKEKWLRVVGEEYSTHAWIELVPERHCAEWLYLERMHMSPPKILIVKQIC